MVKLRWYENEYVAEKAVKTENSVILYSDGHEIIRIRDIYGAEWSNIELLEGEWTPESEIPTAIDILRADVDYLLMLLDDGGSL